LGIGGAVGGGSVGAVVSPFAGLIDEASLYNRALSASEIQGIYGAASDGKCTSGLGCVTPPANLVGWWRGESNATDNAGVNNGTLENGAAFTVGAVGQAFSFDGVNDHVRVPDASDLRFTSAMTAEAWVFPTSIGSDQHIFSKWDIVGGINQRSYALAISSAGYAYIIGSPNGTATGYTVVYSSATVPINQWTHIAGTYDGSNLKIYINGTLDNSASYSGGIFAGTDDLGIGGAVGGGSVGAVVSPFAGLIDEASLYNRALSGSEIQSIFNAGSAGKCH